MKVIVPGHRYELQNYERPAEPGQKLQFIHKVPDPAGSQFLRTTTDGTTNEEVLKMLIDRMATLQAKLPCRENAIVITKLEEALMWLEKRARDRLAAGIAGTAASQSIEARCTPHRICSVHADHHPECDVNDRNPDGIRKPCNCGLQKP